MILDRIVASKRTELERLIAAEPLEALQAELIHAPAPRSFSQALTAHNPYAIIAEVKYRSPSAGIIREPFDPVAIAQVYAAHGAAAISVLTESEFFGGSFLYLSHIRAAVSPPLLCKDFIIDAYQVYLARRFGADAILLIAAILDDPTLSALLELTARLGMDALVEVHDRDQLRRVSDLGAKLVGVNNRDLRSFRTDIETSITLASALPKDSVAVSESGFGDPDEIRRVVAVGYQAVLIGEHLMRAADQGQELERLYDTH